MGDRSQSTLLYGSGEDGKALKKLAERILVKRFAKYGLSKAAIPRVAIRTLATLPDHLVVGIDLEHGPGRRPTKGLQ